MNKKEIEKVKAEIARLKDMAVRLQGVGGDGPDEDALLREGFAGVGAVIEAFEAALDIAEGRTMETHGYGPDVEGEVGPPDPTSGDENASGVVDRDV